MMMVHLSKNPNKVGAGYTGYVENVPLRLLSVLVYRWVFVALLRNIELNK